MTNVIFTSPLLSVICGALCGFAVGCSESGMPDAESLDGNLIVGDALVDLGPNDTGPPEDLGQSDAGDPDLGDLDFGEGDASDAATEDLGIPDMGDPCAEPAVATVTSSAALGDLMNLQGMIVRVTGVLEQAALECSKGQCPKNDPCCQRCTSDVTIDGRITLVGTACFNPAPGCTGTNCAQTCRPPILGLEQVLRGRLVDDGGRATLELLAVE